LRQPRLVVTLVLGPFLILFIFGIGYRNQPRAMRTLFVTQPNSTLAQDIQQNKDTMGAWLIYAGVTGDQKEALGRLNRGEVDLVIVEPEDAYNTIKSNSKRSSHSTIARLTPHRSTTIAYVGQVYVTALNQLLLRSYAVQGQTDAVNLHSNLQEAQQTFPPCARPCRAEMKRLLSKSSKA